MKIKIGDLVTKKQISDPYDPSYNIPDGDYLIVDQHKFYNQNLNKEQTASTIMKIGTTDTYFIVLMRESWRKIG